MIITDAHLKYAFDQLAPIHEMFEQGQGAVLEDECCQPLGILLDSILVDTHEEAARPRQGNAKRWPPVLTHWRLT